MSLLKSRGVRSPVRFLTQEVGGGEKAAALATQAHDLMAERPNIKIQVAGLADRLHDRYILSADSLLIIGPGIKDLGGRESLVLLMNNSVAEDIVTTLRQSFELRWRSAAPI